MLLRLRVLRHGCRSCRVGQPDADHLPGRGGRQSSSGEGMRTSINSRFLIGSAAGAIALAMAMPVAAQEAQSSVMNDEPSNAEIIVTGIRGSLQRNMEIKRTASGVVRSE